MPLHNSRNEESLQGKTVKNAANAHIFCARHTRETIEANDDG